jgi:hypothetical protein
MIKIKQKIVFHNCLKEQRQKQEQVFTYELKKRYDK